VLVRALEGDKANRTQQAVVLAEIKGVTRLLPACRFMHIRRDANQVAHGLARLAIQARCAKVMRFQAPSEVQALVDREWTGRLRAYNSNPI
jgi:hypothetical protein